MAGGTPPADGENTGDEDRVRADARTGREIEDGIEQGLADDHACRREREHPSTQMLTSQYKWLSIHHLQR